MEGYAGLQNDAAGVVFDKADGEVKLEIGPIDGRRGPHEAAGFGEIAGEVSALARQEGQDPAKKRDRADGGRSDDATAAHEPAADMVEMILRLAPTLFRSATTAMPC
ncbi:hypothetical protein [Rhizobium sp. 9140]|uniref:hypothetical protein n=1 Tax=Rhizobium sp. 9140 TaxID=1761900 RepID=UPI001FD9FF3D|nr:hypothetical protein [Rhizobium sp. 9140]